MSSSQGPVGATLPTGALVIGWVVVVPVVVAFAVWSTALSGPGLILTVLLVGVALAHRRAAEQDPARWHPDHRALDVPAALAAITDPPRWTGPSSATATPARPTPC